MYLLVIFIVSYFYMTAFAGIDEKSIFYNARRPASELDLQLNQIENSWRQRFGKYPEEPVKKAFPMISRIRILVDLGYYRDDLISATGWIMNIDEFLKLSTKERKLLVARILDVIRTDLEIHSISIVDEHGMPTKRIENRHIKLSLMINDIRKNDKGQEINISLPLSIGSGVAGYKKGQFVFSKDYYLNLLVHKGVAKSGDSKMFVIEKE